MFLVTLAPLWASCTTTTQTPDDAVVRCRSALECPSDLVCHEVTRSCEKPGVDATQFPALRVAFVNPVSDAAGIPVNTTIVLAFSANVDETMIDQAVHLRAIGGTEVAIERVPGELSNTFQFSLEAGVLLQELAAYEIIVDAGLEAPLGEPVRPMEEQFRSVFTTGVAPDGTPPGPVRNLVIERESGRVRMYWDPPDDDDFAGVLIVRAENQAVTGAPQGQVAYGLGHPVGDSVSIARARTSLVARPRAATDLSTFTPRARHPLPGITGRGRRFI